MKCMHGYEIPEDGSVGASCLGCASQDLAYPDMARRDLDRGGKHIADLERRLAESEAGAARMREVLEPFSECAARMPGEVGPPLNVDIVSLRTGEHIVSTSAHTFRCAADALSSTAGVDLLREVQALRELELCSKKLHQHPRSEGWIRCSICEALAAVDATRRSKP